MEENRKQLLRRGLAAAAVLLWTGFIWHNSLIPGVRSMANSQNLIDAVEPILTSMQIPSGNWQFAIRKTAHFLEFALLGGLWMWMLRQWMEMELLLPASVMIFCVATASTDEFIQIFTGRTSRIQDIIIDSAGAFLGILLSLFFLGICRRCRQGKKT